MGDLEKRTCKLIDYIRRHHPDEWEEYKEEYIDALKESTGCCCDKDFLMNLPPL